MSKNKKDDNENQMFTEEELQALEKVNLNDFRIKKQEIQQIVDNNVNDIIEYDNQDRQRRIKIEQINKKMDKEIIFAEREKDELLQQIDQEKMNNHKELEKLKAQKQEKLQLIAQEKETLISQLKSQIDYLKSDLMAYKDDEQEEQNYLNEIETLEALGGETVDKHMQEIRKLRRNQAKIAYKLDSVASAKLEDIQKSAFKMAQKQVAYEEQEKVQTNINLKKQLFSLQEEVKQMKKENEILLNESKQYQIDMKLDQEGIIAYQQFNANQLTQIKKLKEQVEGLKQQISQKVTDFHREVEFIKIQDNQRSQELEKEKNLVKEQIKIKQEELKIYKPLAQCILKQKQEVEQFFVQYLQEIQKEIKQRKKEKLKQNLNFQSLSLSLPKNPYSPKKQRGKLSMQANYNQNNGMKNSNSSYKLPQINQKAYQQRNNSLTLNSEQINSKNKGKNSKINNENFKYSQKNQDNTNQNPNNDKSFSNNSINNQSFNSHHTQKQQSQQQQNYSEKLELSKIDIKDLQLEEKEKLLRVLLVNVNNGKPAEDWEEMYNELNKSNFSQTNDDTHIQQYQKQPLENQKQNLLIQNQDSRLSIENQF